MVSPNRIAEVAAVMADPARAAMLSVLMDGRALTALELAGIAGITPQTASSHLARLVGAGLLAVTAQGRHRYHRLADPAVARMLEVLMQHASGRAISRSAPRVGPRDAAIRQVRTCYDHLAGRIAVDIADVLVRRGHVVVDEEAGLITEAGSAFLSTIGLALPAMGELQQPSRRPMCRLCLDWSERRSHLAGRLGAALCRHSLETGWFRRVDGSRALSITPKGRRALAQTFAIEC